MARRFEDDMKIFVVSKQLLLIIGLLWTNGTGASDWQAELTATEKLVAQAKMEGSLWRDTEKLVENAKELKSTGKHQDALVLLNEAKQQATLATVQASQQFNNILIPYYLK